jgi:hypothetical protein
MSRSWGHTARRLTPAEIDYADRWGEHCGTGKCAATATHRTGYRYVTGRRGRTSDASRLACEVHAQRFAIHYGVVIADAPERTPPRAPGLLAAAAMAFDPDPERVSLRRERHGWCVREAGHGFVVSGAFTVTLAQATELDQAIAVVEDEFGRRRRLVPATPWQRQGDQATTTLVRAENTPAWATVPWKLTVWCDRGTWTLRRGLAEQFRPEVDRLGDTNMDLARAIRTATALMDDEGWIIVSSWVASAEIATTRATRAALVGTALGPMVTETSATTRSGSEGARHG